MKKTTSQRSSRQGRSTASGRSSSTTGRRSGTQTPRSRKPAQQEDEE